MQKLWIRETCQLQISQSIKIIALSILKDQMAAAQLFHFFYETEIQSVTSPKLYSLFIISSTECWPILQYETGESLFNAGFFSCFGED